MIDALAWVGGALLIGAAATFAWQRRQRPRTVPGARVVRHGYEGMVFGGYQADRLIASGKTWHVYAAHALSGSSLPFVCKVLRSRVVARGVDMPEWLATAEAYSQLKHPAIVGFVGWGQSQGRWYVVQPHSSAMPARGLLSGPVPLDRVNRIMRQLFDALSVLHAAGIVHGRLSLDRIHMTGEDRIELWDLGLGRDRRQSIIGYKTMMEGLSSSAPDPELTERRDQFLLGRVAWELLAGRNLLQDRSPMVAAQTLMKVQAPVLSELRPDLPSELVGVIARMLQLSPAQRFPSVRDAERAWILAVRAGQESPRAET